MKKQLATVCFAVGSLLGPVIAQAEDTGTDFLPGLGNLQVPVTLSALIGPVIADATDSNMDRMHPITYVKDSFITTKVKANLFDAKMNSLMHIRVDTDSKGEVTLTGRVRTQELADQALAIARDTSGVNSVVSFIQIKNDE